MPSGSLFEGRCPRDDPLVEFGSLGLYDQELKDRCVPA